LIAPIVEGRADVVFGSRFVGSGEHRVLYFWHSIGNKLLTLASNIFTNLNLTDMETCYKERAHLRSGDLLPWQDLCRGKEDHRQGRLEGDVVHIEVQPLPMNTFDEAFVADR
jgi:hypothetical protein